MSLKVHIKKDFGSFKLEVDFDVENSTLALLGSSGSGKSITLKCIAGIEKPDEGYIELNGRVLFDSEKGINLSPQQRRVGYLFQDYALFPNMNVEQNIMCGLVNFEAEPKTSLKEKSLQKHQKIQELLEFFHLTGLEKHKPHQLSGGQQQRVALARILASNPELLLLDEPFSALDEHLRTGLELEMKSLIKDFAREVVLVTHNRDEAYIMSDTMVVLSQGQSLIQKNTKELFKDPEFLAVAIITGCKNYASCEIKNEKTIFVPDWGIELTVSKKVPIETKYVAIRAHYFAQDEKQNRQKIRIVDFIEQPFENQIRFVFDKQKNNSNSICWFVDKQLSDINQTKEVGINPNDVLLLK